MGPDFWWGVVAASGAWTLVGCTAALAFTWTITRDGHHDR